MEVSIWPSLATFIDNIMKFFFEQVGSRNHACDSNGSVFTSDTSLSLFC